MVLRDAFTIVAGRQRTPGIEFLEAIRLQRTDLENRPADFCHSGVTAYVALFDREAFKGPKRACDIEVIEFERRLLQHMEGRVPFIPRVTCVGDTHVFFSTEMVEGVPFERAGYSCADLGAGNDGDCGVLTISPY